MQKAIAYAILFLVINITIYSCKKEKPVPPTVTTSAATEVSYTTAVSGGIVTDEGDSPVTARGICWSISPDPTISDDKLSDNGRLGAFSGNITLLIPDTTYYVRAYATNSSGTSYGNQNSFKTLQVEVPVMTTRVVTSITQTTAIAGGEILDDKGAAVSARGICWSTLQTPTVLDNKTENGSGTGLYESSMSGLTANTTYFVRSYSVNSAGTAYGNEQTFITSPGPAVILTSEISSITTNSFIGGGNITTDGGLTITEYGLVWSTSQDPTVADNKHAIPGSYSGIYTINVNSLSTNTIYYVRAYAINNIGTSYGNQVSFKTDPLNVEDIDGNMYNVVRIGAQLWMSENLKTTKYKDGTPIPLVTDNMQWGLNYTHAYCWYNNDEGNKNVIGALYNWFTVSTGKLCPEGWHVPSGTEWIQLEDYLVNNGFNFDGTTAEYKIAKSLAATTGWNLSGIVGSIGNTDFPSKRNVTGFTAVSAGFRATNGVSYNKGISTILWSSTANNPGAIHQRTMEYNESKILRNYSQGRVGASVRCLQD